MAIGSCLSIPTFPEAAAVVSEDIIDPIKTPLFQFFASYTRGVVYALRPPNIIAEIGTPSGLSNSLLIQGQFLAGAVNLLLGCAPFSVDSFPFQGSPFQLTALDGGFLSSPSHQTVLSSILCATLVNIVFF